MILDLLADGSVNMTAVTILAPHLTPENHRAVLAGATHRTKDEIKVIQSRLAPRPDVPSSIRKLAAPAPVAENLAFAAKPAEDPRPASGTPTRPTVQPPPNKRLVLEPLTPERYRVQFTVSQTPTTGC